MFADDVFLYGYGDQSSIDCLMDGVNLFSSISRLLPNKEKNMCFFANVADDIQIRVLNITGFQKGSLPIRYLGLPLISTKLSHRDCNPYEAQR